MNNEQLERGESLAAAAWARLRVNKPAMAALAFILIVAIASVIGPLICANGFDKQNLDIGPTAPSAAHWCGTDGLGRDLLARTLHGGRISLAVGLCATLVSIAVGVLFGAVSGYFGGRVDAFMMRMVDILYALPFTIFVILLMVLFGRNILLIFVAIGAVEWLTMARIVRGQTLSIRQSEYIEAAISLGLGWPRVILLHVLPNLLGVVIVYATLTVPRVMLLEAFLSFLGLGVQPPMCSWGGLIRDGAEVMEESAWLLLFPCAIFSLTLLSLNIVGDGLRDALDPKLTRD